MILSNRPCHRAVLLTGVTGLIGGELAIRLAEVAKKVYVLVRADTSAHAKQRLRQRLARSGHKDNDTIVPVRGDTRREDWGLSGQSVRVLSAQCDIIIHAAAETSFRRNAPCCQTNVGGARNLIAMLRKWRKRPSVFFVSTASVVLAPGPAIGEEHSFCGYTNGYILSKRRAETILRAEDLDLVILRPSIVMSRGIPDAAFGRSILWALPVLLRLGVAPVESHARIDIVPVDYVAESIVMLAAKTPQHECYHISAGPELSVSCGEIANYVVESGLAKTFRFVDREQWEETKRSSVVHGRLARAVEYYLPFLASDAVYSNDRLHSEFGAEMPSMPRFTEYCGEILDVFSSDEAVAASDDP